MLALSSNNVIIVFMEATNTNTKTKGAAKMTLTIYTDGKDQNFEITSKKEFENSNNKMISTLLGCKTNTGAMRLFGIFENGNSCLSDMQGNVLLRNKDFSISNDFRTKGE